MADFEVNKRLKTIIESVYKLSPLDFSAKYNDKKGQKTYNILNEKYGLSNKMLVEILQAYPEINKVWLLTGEGEILKGPLQESNSCPKKEKIPETFNEFFEALKRRDEQIDRLITLLEEKLSSLPNGDNKNKEAI